MTSRTGLRSNHVLEAVILLGSDLADEQVVEQLVRDGCAARTARKLCILIPMAFACEAFEPSGVRFLPFFQVLETPPERPEGGLAGCPQARLRRRPIARESWFARARQLARRLSASGRLEAFHQVVRRGNEYEAIREAYRQGTPFHAIRLETTETILG